MIFFPPLVLILNGIIFTALGLWSLWLPEAIAESVSLELPASDSRIEISAMYGGLELIFGLYFLYAAFQRKTMREGLKVGIFLCLGLAMGRAIGLVRYWPDEPGWMLSLLMTESVLVLLGLIALRILTQYSTNSSTPL